jgi:hypothetical protein
MPWKEGSVSDERLRFAAKLPEGESMNELCRDFGISRKTGYEIFNRCKESGFEALSARQKLSDARYALRVLRSADPAPGRSPAPARRPRSSRRSRSTSCATLMRRTSRRRASICSPSRSSSGTPTPASRRSTTRTWRTRPSPAPSQSCRASGPARGPSSPRSAGKAQHEAALDARTVLSDSGVTLPGR